MLASLISDNQGHALRSAQIWIADRFPAAPEPLWRGERYQHERIRICYLSGDFHEHPVAYALAGVLELLPAVLPRRLTQREVGRAGLLFDLHERLRHQPVE